MILIGTLVLCIVLAGGAVGVLYWLNLLPGFERESSGFGPVNRDGPSQGCLLTVLAFSFIWFAAWSVVLVLALRFLRTPLD
ncbi:MAG: hypothetical protein KY439_05130 [Actinobacteria bacterium]|nr:hypothetical protein [Actinomycetota bacterium]